MTVPATMLVEATAYRQLSAPEKAFVDGYVREIEREAAQRNERITHFLFKPLPVEGLLDRPLVRAAVAERINEIGRDSELTVHRVVKSLMNVAFASMENYIIIGDDGVPSINLQGCTPEQLEAIAGFEIEENQTRSGFSRKFKFKLHDKLSALGKLSQYMGITENDNPHWRADNARPVNPALSADTSTDAAADMYASMINA